MTPPPSGRALPSTTLLGCSSRRGPKGPLLWLPPHGSLGLGGGHAADGPEPASWGHSLPHPPPLVRSLKVPGGARSAGASSPVRTGLANSGRRVERLPLKVGDDPLAVAEMCGAGCPPNLESPSLWDPRPRGQIRRHFQREVRSDLSGGYSPPSGPPSPPLVSSGASSGGAGRLLHGRRLPSSALSLAFWAWRSAIKDFRASREKLEVLTRGGRC